MASKWVNPLVHHLKNLTTSPSKFGYIGWSTASAPHTLRISIKNVCLCINLDQCNLHCVMCWQTYAREANRQIRQTTEMDFAALWNLAHNRWLVHTTISIVGGGEPFLYTKINDVLLGIPTPNRRLMIMTNGTLLHRSHVLWEVAEEVALTLMFSIDAAKPSTYQEIRRGGEWTQLMKNIDRYAALMKQNPCLKLSTSFVVIKQNLHELIDFLQMSAEWGCDYVHIHPAIKGGFPEELLVDTNSQEYQGIIEEAARFANTRGIALDRPGELQVRPAERPGSSPPASKARQNPLPPNDPRRGCQQHSDSMTVSVNGDIYLCDTAFRINYSCGNIFSDSFQNVWLSTEWLSVRLAHALERQHTHPLCRHCLLTNS
jgi:radical SAM protein with 4Fe4S-binding SPASM domain